MIDYNKFLNEAGLSDTPGNWTVFYNLYVTLFLRQGEWMK